MPSIKISIKNMPIYFCIRMTPKRPITDKIRIGGRAEPSKLGLGKESFHTAKIITNL